MSFSIPKGVPDDAVTMSLSASPESLCAYGTVDKSVYLKGGDNQLKQETLTELISRFKLYEWSGYVLYSAFPAWCR